MANVKTLGEDLPQEIARVRDEVLPLYMDIGPAGEIGATFIKHSLWCAHKSIESRDIVAMLAAYNRLKSIKD